MRLGFQYYRIKKLNSYFYLSNTHIMELYKISNELTKVSKIIDEAEQTGKMLVDADYYKDLSKDPYPLFFTAKQLFEEITKGNWHCHDWLLEDKEAMKQAILKRIIELQERLIKL